MPDSKEKTKNLHSIRDYFLVALIAISLSFLLGPNFGPVALFLITTYVVAVHMPSQYKIQQFALASIFIVGLSPVYLITRGFLIRSNLNVFDFQIYMSMFLLGSVLVILKKESTYPPRLILSTIWIPFFPPTTSLKIHAHSIPHSPIIKPIPFILCI